MINCISYVTCVGDPSARGMSGADGMQLTRGVSRTPRAFCCFLSQIISNFANRFMRCRQNTVGTGKPAIQHRILHNILAEYFIKKLRASHTHGKNTSSIMRICRCNHEPRDSAGQMARMMKGRAFAFLECAKMHMSCVSNFNNFIRRTITSFTCGKTNRFLSKFRNHVVVLPFMPRIFSLKYSLVRI